MKVPQVRRKKAISDFPAFTVTCTYSDVPLLGSDPGLVEIIKKEVISVPPGKLTVISCQCQTCFYWGGVTVPIR